jgi:hypothetical protein
MILEDPLVELVQEIWGEAREDVAIRKILPEWMVRSQSQVSKVLCVTYCGVFHRFQCTCRVSSCGELRMPTLLCLYNTTRAAVLLTACSETLLRVIGHIRGKNGENLTNKTISTCHLDSRVPCIHERSQQRLHTVMEDLLALGLPL